MGQGCRSSLPVTALVGWISNATGYSVFKYVPLWELVWFSNVANISITGMNLSLMLNSVGFYQISKLSMIPLVYLMERVLHSKHYTTKMIMSVIVVAFGVGICTVIDVEINAKGFVCACVAVFCTSLQQITIGSFQKKYNIGSFELLSKTAPIQATSLIVFGPFIDYYLNGHSLFKYPYSAGAIVSLQSYHLHLIAKILAKLFGFSLHIMIKESYYLFEMAKFLRRMAQPYDKTGCEGKKTLLSEEDVMKMSEGDMNVD